MKSSYGQPPRALDKRFSPETRATLVAAFAAGVEQQHLAEEYGISIRSVKRLIQQSRNAEPTRLDRVNPGRANARHSTVKVASAKIGP